MRDIVDFQEPVERIEAEESAADRLEWTEGCSHRRALRHLEEAGYEVFGLVAVEEALAATGQVVHSWEEHPNSACVDLLVEDCGEH